VLSACHFQPSPFSTAIRFPLHIYNATIYVKCSAQFDVTKELSTCHHCAHYYCPAHFGGGSEPSSCVRHCPLARTYIPALYIYGHNLKAFANITHSQNPRKCSAFCKKKNICISFSKHRNQFASEGVGDSKRIPFTLYPCILVSLCHHKRGLYVFRNIVHYGTRRDNAPPVALCPALNV